MTSDNLAFFISSHGFGHAARACAVMLAISKARPSVHFSIYTRVPKWFFDGSFNGGVAFSYSPLDTDVGFIQATSMREDYDATIKALTALYPFREEFVSGVSENLRHGGVRGVLCDISVLGLVAARQAGIPSIIIENFTWDWIYARYADEDPRFQRFVDYLRPLYYTATLRVQAEPICVPVEGALKVSVLARPIRNRPDAIRQELGIPTGASLVMCTMGGVPGTFQFLPALRAHKDIFFILAGTEPSQDLPSNVRAVPHSSNLYHPDLVAASDAIIGKVGYSTVAEAYYGRTQFLYVPRRRFAESEVMEQFVTRELCGVEIEQGSFDDGSWVARVPSILRKPAELPENTSGPEDPVVRAVERLMLS